MKKLLLLLTAGTMLLYSCGSKDKKADGDKSDLAAKNKAAADMVLKAFQTGDASQIDSAVSADFVDHSPQGIGNRDSLKSMIGMVKMMNARFEEVQTIADDNYVFQLMKISGTSDGSFMPAGPYEFTEVQVCRCKDGKIVEHWSLMEPRHMAGMMAGMPPPAGGLHVSSPAADATSADLSEKAKKNLDVMHSVSAAINSGDMSKLGDYFAKDMIDYGADGGPKKGADSVIAGLKLMTQNMSGMKSEVLKEVANDDYAMSWMKFTWTPKTDMMGMKAGQEYSSTALEVAQYNAEGKVIAHWTYMTQAEMMQMMGGAGSDNTAPPPPPAKDTTKNK